MGRLTHMIRLAVAELLDQWPIAVSVALAVMAVLAPLLVLDGLRNGVVGEILSRLRDDPAMRLVGLQATGARRFDDAWFADMRQSPDVGFVLPATRYAATQIVVQVRRDGEDQEIRATLIPTAAGDPVFADRATRLADDMHARMSAALAAATGLTDGSTMQIFIPRSGTKYRTAGVTRGMKIDGVAKSGDFRGRALFVTPEFLAQVQEFRDGYRAPLLGGTDGEIHDRQGAATGFRLYARDIESVGPLMARLRNVQALSVQGRQGEIASALNLAASISAVLQTIFVVGGIGLVGTLIAIQAAMAANRRRTIAMFGLIGFGTGAMVSLPIIQAVILSLLGGSAALGLSIAVAEWINLYFADSFGADGAACVISAVSGAAGIGTILILSVIPALLIGLRFARLEPADEIRDA